MMGLLGGGGELAVVLVGSGASVVLVELVAVAFLPFLSSLTYGGLPTTSQH